MSSGEEARGRGGGGGTASLKVGTHCLTTAFFDIQLYKRKFSVSKISKYLLPLESGNLELEQTNFPVFWQKIKYLLPLESGNLELVSKPNSLCFGNISKFPMFSLTGNLFCHFSLFSLCSGYPACLFFNIVLKPSPYLGRYAFPRLSTPPPLLSLSFKWLVGGGGGYGGGGWSGWQAGGGGGHCLFEDSYPLPMPT